MDPLPLSAGLAVSDHVEAPPDGRVEVGSYKLSITCSPRQALFRAVLGEQTFDLSEASPATHIAVVGAGRGMSACPSAILSTGSARRAAATSGHNAREVQHLKVGALAIPFSTPASRPAFSSERPKAFQARM